MGGVETSAEGAGHVWLSARTTLRGIRYSFAGVTKPPAGGCLGETLKGRAKDLGTAENCIARTLLAEALGKLVELFLRLADCSDPRT